jgi:peptidoglycan/xylan/chitin deacetylase (PgdA/CDA1 family)
MGLEKKLGFRSSFNFVPRRYAVQPDLRNVLTKEGFEVGVHGLYHDGRYFDSREKFRKRAEVINDYLKEWGSVGFRSPSMLHNLDWIHDLNIEYDASTFDTDPFEPQPNGVGTIFPFWVPRKSSPCSSLLVPCSVSSGVQPSSSNLQPPTASVNGYVELPYTLPQDFTLFILMKERDVNIWRRKLDWIVEHGGMALLLTHPDYMNGEEKNCGIEEYPVRSYEEFLRYIRTRYQDQFWNPLPKEMARFWKENMVFPQLPESVE